MQYVLLIYEDPAERARLSDGERQGLFPEYRQFTDSIVKSGNYRAGNPLEPVSAATSVRLRQGKRMVTDGPFAETKEHLGGYYLVEAKDLDEAIGIAARIPSARFGTVEVRPVMKIEH